MGMLKLSEVVQAVNGKCYSIEDLEFTEITTNSREVRPGSLFVALVGERFDGHEFCAAALKAGAAAVLVSRQPDDLPAEALVIKTEDTLEAYLQIARAYREKMTDLKVVAITGSNGKTSTKDLVAACLAQKYRVVKTEANFNNEIGIPKTLLNIKPDTQIAVVEIGMRGLGQISRLAAIAQPDVAVVTNVGETHIELLGSMDNIAKAKAELVTGLLPSQAAVLNADNQYTARMAQQTAAEVTYFGTGELADVCARKIEIAATGNRFECYIKRTGEHDIIELPMIGMHNVENALAAIAAGSLFGVQLKDSKLALKQPQLTAKRQEVLEFGRVTVVNDAYNASPASMFAALDMLERLKNAKNGRSIAVLADMLELGAVSVQAHEEVGVMAAARHTDIVVTFGEAAKLIAAKAAAAGCESFVCEDVEAAGKQLAHLVKDNDVVLLKGSHSMQVDRIIDLVFKK